MAEPDTETRPVEAQELEEARRRVLVAALAGAARVALVGAGERAAELAAWRPDLFAMPDAEPVPGTEVLALGRDETTLGRAAELARGLGTPRVFVLAEGLPDAGSLRSAGLVLVGWDRFFWEPAERPATGVSRTERLEAETRDVLLRCVLADDARALDELEGAVVELQRRLDVAAQLEVDHARTREAERARAERLRELEETVSRIGSVDLLAEVERLRAEIESMRSTRVWRIGAGWWRFRDRIRGAG